MFKGTVCSKKIQLLEVISESNVFHVKYGVIVFLLKFFYKFVRFKKRHYGQRINQAQPSNLP
jgi:hypothetical protein